MTALAWLNDLVQWFARWVPRLVLIEPTHCGVRFGPRGGAKQVGPGLVLFWPITHNLVQLPITTQSVQLASQALYEPNSEATVIPRVLLCGAAIQFRIHNPVDAAVRSLHVHALVDNRSQAAIARHIDKRSDAGFWAECVIRDLAPELEPYGVTVERLDFVHNGIGMALKNVADWNYNDSSDGKRPNNA